MTDDMKTKEEIIEQNKKLVKEFPFIIPRDYEGNPPKDYDYLFTELDYIPDGWRKQYGRLICEDIKRILGDRANEFRFLEIKEKYGELRIYGSIGNAELDNQLNKYEYLTGNTCIFCGKIGVPSTKGYILPVCKECYPKANFGVPYEECTTPNYEFKPVFEIRKFTADGDISIYVNTEDIIERAIAQDTKDADKE